MGNTTGLDWDCRNHLPKPKQVSKFPVERQERKRNLQVVINLKYNLSKHFFAIHVYHINKCRLIHVSGISLKNFCKTDLQL